MGQGCHWPPHPSSSSLPLFSHALTTSLQAGRGGATAALLSTISPGMGAQAGCSPARGISIRSAEPLTACCFHIGASFALPSSSGRMGMLSPMLSGGS